MRVHEMIRGVVGVGAMLLMGACGPTDEPPDRSGTVSRFAEGGGQFCGGIANIQCPPGLLCVDNPLDDCDPSRDGRDCGGICTAEETPQPLTSCGGEPGYSYVLTDPQACQGVRFKCPAGATAFFNDCGCGCKTTP